MTTDEKKPTSLDDAIKNMSDFDYAIFVISTMGGSFGECDRCHKEALDDIRARGPVAQQPPRMACKFDLQAYENKEILFEDIRACNGESCNYCGRFNTVAQQQVPLPFGGKFRFERDGLHVLTYGPEETILPKDHDAAMRAEGAKAERERVLTAIDDYINSHALWLPGTDDRVVNARELIRYTRILRSSNPGEQQEQGGTDVMR